MQEHEQSLCDSFKEQARHYTDALCIARKLPDAFKNGCETDVLQDLGVIMNRVSDIDQAARDTRTDWTESQSKPGKELSETLDSVESILSELIKQMDQAEKTATEAKNRLMPEISHQLKGKQMMTAYKFAGEAAHRA